MATMRDQQPANIQQPGYVQIQQSRSPMDSQRQTTDIPVNDSGRRILEIASRLAKTADDTAAEEEYLRGANAAATGQSLDQLDSNLLTRPLQEGGFNDQTKRMQMAQVSADITANMPKYKTLKPEDFLQVINDKTGGLIANTDGMTMGARKSLLENQVTFNRTLIRNQAVEHAKYLVDQRSQMYTAQGNALVGMTAQAKASGDVQSYGEASAATMTWARSILTDESLPIDQRQQLVTGAMGYMLANDLRTPVEMAVNSGIFDSLPADKLTQLQGQIRESRNRTEVQDNSDLLDQWSQLNARQATYGDVSPDQFSALQNEMVKRNLMTTSGYMSSNEQFYKDYAKQAKAGQLAGAYAAGNQTGILQLQATEEDGANAFIKARVRQGATSDQVASDLLNVGMQHGFPSAYKKAAGLMEPAISNFGTEQQMSPDAADHVLGMMDKIGAAELRGDTTAWSKLLSGLSPENQEKMVYMREQVKSGKSVDQAGQSWIKQQNDYAGMAPAQRRSILSDRQRDINSVLKSLEAQGRFSRAWQGLAGVFSDQSRNMFQARVSSGDVSAVSELNEVQAAYREELQAVILKNPSISNDGMSQLASAQLAQRTIRVGESTFSPGSVLIAPRGQTVGGMLGLPAEVAPDRVGAAIAGVTEGHTPEGYGPVYSFNAQGGLTVSYVDKTGNIAPQTTTITPQAVQQRIADDDRAAATANNQVYGEGKLLIDPQTNLGVRVNGQNTAGVDENMMLTSREKLVQFEGIRDTAYQDGGGKTNGVGIHQNSPFYGASSIAGKWTPETIQRSFVDHTNWLARKLPGTANQLGWAVDRPAQFQFMMQMGYQAGPSWTQANGYKDLADKIRTGDPSALEALRNTPAYKAAQPERRAFYEQTLTLGMRE